MGHFDAYKYLGGECTVVWDDSVGAATIGFFQGGKAVECFADRAVRKGKGALQSNEQSAVAVAQKPTVVPVAEIKTQPVEGIKLSPQSADAAKSAIAALGEKIKPTATGFSFDVEGGIAGVTPPKPARNIDPDEPKGRSAIS